MVKVLTFSILSFWSLSIFSQYDGNSSSWITNHALYNNPGITGNRNTLLTNLSFRNDWLLSDDSPKTLTFSAHTPLKNQKWSTGLLLINDRFAETSNNSALGLISYKITTTRGKLSLGFKSGINVNTRQDHFELHDANDVFFEQQINFTTLSLGIGAYFKADNYYIGVSIPEFSNKNNPNFIDISDPRYWHKRYIAGKSFQINEKLESLNHLVIRQLGKGKPQVLLLSILKINTDYEVGISTRSGNTFGGLLSYYLNRQIKFTYNFDKTFEKSYPNSFGNHELLVSYTFGKVVETNNSKFF